MKKLPVEREELAVEKGLSSTADGERGNPRGRQQGRSRSCPCGSLPQGLPEVWTVASGCLHIAWLCRGVHQENLLEELVQLSCCWHIQATVRNVHCLSITCSGTEELEVMPAWGLLSAAPTVVLAVRHL